MRNRLRIVGVGEIGLWEGEVVMEGWRFGMPEGTPKLEVPVIDGRLAGWTAVELHAIAHGVPCPCALGGAHAEEGLLD